MLMHRQGRMTWAERRGDRMGIPVSWHEQGGYMAVEVTLAQNVGVERKGMSDLVIRQQLCWDKCGWLL